MEVDFSKYNIGFCESCKNRGLICCSRCISGNEYLSRPTEFEGRTEMEELYFELLEGYTKFLHNIGLEIKKY